MSRPYLRWFTIVLTLGTVVLVVKVGRNVVTTVLPKEEYLYRQIYSPKSVHAVTVITYIAPELPNPLRTRYVIAGFSNAVLPLAQPYIQFPGDIAIIVEWLDDTHCMILSSTPAIHFEDISPQFTVDIKVDNPAFQRRLQERPDLSI